MAFWKNKNDAAPSGMPPAPGAPGAVPPPPPGAPRPPMAPNMAGPKPPMAPGAVPPPPPGAPRPPMAPNMAGPKPPMAPGAVPPPPGAPKAMVPAGAPGFGPKPPMAPGAVPPPPGAPKAMVPAGAPGFGPKPPMAPGAGPSFGAPAGAPGFGPKPPMAPGAGPSFGAPGFGPRPMGPSMGAAPSFGQPGNMSASGFGGSMMSSEGYGQPVQQEVNITLDSYLGAKKGYKPTRSVLSNARVTYEQFCSELSFEFFDNMLRSSNLLERKSEITKIKKALVFALSNTKDLPDRPRDILYNAALRFVDFLKAVVYYPEKGIINDEIVTYMPMLKDVAHSFRSFLLKNR